MLQWKAIREREQPYHAGTVRLYRERLDDQHAVVDTVQVEKWESLKVVSHSPDGFEMGYRGSGPAQLALAILLEYFGTVEGPGAETRAQLLYQGFKDAFVSTWKDVGFVTEGELERWVEDQRHFFSESEKERWETGGRAPEAREGRSVPQPTPQATPEEIPAVHPSAAPSEPALDETRRVDPVLPPSDRE
jgi:hypothetical protein